MIMKPALLHKLSAIVHCGRMISSAVSYSVCTLSVYFIPIVVAAAHKHEYGSDSIVGFFYRSPIPFRSAASVFEVRLFIRHTRQPNVGSH